MNKREIKAKEKEIKTLKEKIHKLEQKVDEKSGMSDRTFESILTAMRKSSGIFFKLKKGHNKHNWRVWTKANAPDVINKDPPKTVKKFKERKGGEKDEYLDVVDDSPAMKKE